MKKILLIILTCFYLTNVQAFEYSEYSDYGDYTEEVINGSDLIDVKKERRYKYYKLQKVLGPYEEKNSFNEDYPYVDLDDFNYTKESDYLLNKPLEKEGRVITEYDGLHYKKVKEITSIRINNQSSDYYIKVTNLFLTYKGEKISYEKEYFDADEEGINPNGYIILKLSQKLDIKDISFRVKFSGAGEKGVYMSFNMISYDNKPIYSQNGYFNEGSLLLSLIYNESFVYSDSYDNYYTIKENSFDDMKLVGELPLYTYKDILYRKYNLEKEYYNDYLTRSFEDYIYKDELDFKDYYACRKRTILNNNLFTSQDSPIVIENAKLVSANKIDDNMAFASKKYEASNGKVIKGNHDNDKKTSFKKFPLFIVLIGIIILFLSKRYKKTC